MPSVADCAIENGLTLEELNQFARYGQVTPENIDDVAAMMVQDIQGQARNRLLTLQADARAAKSVLPNTSKFNSAVRAVKGLLVRDLQDNANTMSIEGYARGYAHIAYSELAEAAREFSPTMTGGVNNKELLIDALRVAGGGQARNGKANTIGTGIRQALDKAHQLLVDAGGDIGRIVNYLPQTHSATKLTKVGRDQWVSEVMPLLKREAMVDKNGVRLEDADLITLLEYVYDSVTTQGAHKVEGKLPKVMGNHFSSRTASRGNMSRILHFNDVDAALKYHEAFGEGDLWGNLTTHINNMTLDAAVIRVLGPDPESSLQRWKQWATRQDKTQKEWTSIDTIWNNLVGFDHHGEDQLSRIFNAGRDVLSTAYMGAALPASIPDVGVVALNAKLNGMNVMPMIAAAAQGGRLSRRQLAEAAGLIEYAISAMAYAPRWEEQLGKGVTRRMADANYRLQGMTGWTNTLDHIWLEENLMSWGRAVDNGRLNKGQRTFLETYGLEDDWDVIKAAGIKTYGQHKMVDLHAIDDPDVKARFMGAIHTERELAIVRPDARSKGVLNAGLSPGTIPGQLVRSGTQFLSWPASFLLNGVTRYATSGRVSGWERTGYLGSMAVSMTLLGAVAFQLKELSKGRELRSTDPTTEEGRDFWVKAFAQGGAVPMLAELILQGQTQYGKGPLEAVIGPTGGAINTGRGLIWSAGELLFGVDGADERLSKNVEQASMMLPYSSLWWSRLMTQRMIRDNVLETIDPLYGDRQERRERNIENLYDQEYYWGYED